MKRIALILLLVALASGPAHAGEISSEFDADYSYVGPSGMENGGKNGGDISEQSSTVRYVVSSGLENGNLFRFGGEWQRYSFSSLPSMAAPLPNTLQSLSAVIGMDVQLWGWIIRIEAQPGFYGDFEEVTSRAFNAPIILGGTYLVNADLQWVAGVSVNWERSAPVLPAAGVRWKFADKWVINAILPRPRLEYEMNKTVTLYAGGDFKIGTYRTSGNFGDAHGYSKLNNSILDYTEIRVGAGASIKAGSMFKVDMETGCMTYREFDYPRAGITVRNERPAAYGQLILNCQF